MKKTGVHSLYLTFFGAPKGYAGIAAPVGTFERVYVESKVSGAVPRIGFHRLSRMEISGALVTACLLDGQTVSGQLRGPVVDGTSFLPSLHGIESYETKKIVQYSKRLSEVALVKFIRP